MTVSRHPMLARLALVCAILGGAAVRADDSFTKGLTPADFKAAGLDRLSPEELARLDALVRAVQTGAVAKATEETTKAVREETTKAVTEQVRKQVQAEARSGAQKPESSGFIDRMKVVLKPGTEIEYTTLDAVLARPFDGWENGTILTLTNGQRWVVTDHDSYYAGATGKPVHVKIVPGALGGFFMEIEGGGRPRVRFLGNTAVPQASQPPAPQ